MSKSKEKNDHMTHVQKSFNLLQKYNMKLNPEKCTFGIASGKFLGYMVTKRGIEAKPYHIKAIIEMKLPRTMKELQSQQGERQLSADSFHDPLTSANWSLLQQRRAKVYSGLLNAKKPSRNSNNTSKPLQ